MKNNKPLVAAIVGIDGCGKSSTARGAIDMLAEHIRIVGLGDEILSGAPGQPVVEQRDVPHSRTARFAGGVAKGLRWQGLYKHLKFLEFTERAHVRDYVANHQRPDAILTDGDPLVNTAAWAAARFYRKELSTSDEELFDVLHFMAGHQRIPVRELPYYLGHAWQLVLLNRLHLARFEFPDLIFLLEIDPAVSMARIRARGRPLQVHETEEFLAQLGQAYDRVCTILEERCDIPVIRIRVDQNDPETTMKIVADAVREHIELSATDDVARHYGADDIEIIATTMSGSIQDQRKVGMIGPAFRSRTDRSVEVHVVDSHDQARETAHEIVAGGGRLVVSAGGAGTFNAVLEGSHLNGVVPDDLRLAFLRKGSADLIGKVLKIPDELPNAAAAIVGGIEHNAHVDADVLAIEAVEPDGSVQIRHMVGFGGLGVFGEVPRFTESRIIKFYKGVLGTLFGDLGPFYTGLVLAVGWWQIKHFLGRVVPVMLTLDGDSLPPDVWGAVTFLNGDLGKDFPLGRGLSLDEGNFRVIALRYRGMRSVLKQINACRTARVLDDPDKYEAIVRDVSYLEALPVEPCPRFMVNVDGLKMKSRGIVRVFVSGRVRLVAGAPAAVEVASPDETALAVAS